MGQVDFVALRRGELKARGWELTERFKQALIKGNATPVAANDIYPAFQQKGVDMRIGIDVASLSLKRLVERIILFSGDTDMVPAIKAGTPRRCAGLRSEAWRLAAQGHARGRCRWRSPVESCRVIIQIPCLT